MAEQPQAKSPKSFGKGKSVSKGKGKGEMDAENPQRQFGFNRRNHAKKLKAQLVAVGMCHWQGPRSTFESSVLARVPQTVKLWPNLRQQLRGVPGGRFFRARQD